MPFKNTLYSYGNGSSTYITFASAWIFFGSHSQGTSFIFLLIFFSQSTSFEYIPSLDPSHLSIKSTSSWKALTNIFKSSKSSDLISIDFCENLVGLQFIGSPARYCRFNLSMTSRAWSNLLFLKIGVPLL